MIPFLESQTKSHLTALMFVVVLPENVKSWCEYGKNMCIVLCSTISMLIHFHLELVEISCFMSEHLTVACFQCSCLHFQQQINFPAKVIICSDFDVIPCCSLAAAPLCQLSSLSSWMRKFKHFVAPFVHINNPPPSLPTLITFNLEFSLSNTFSPFSCPHPQDHTPSSESPPSPPGRPHGSSGVQISVYTGGRGWRHRIALPHRLTSPLMPIYCIWQPLWSRCTSGVEYAYWKQGPTLAQTSVAEQNRWKAAFPLPSPSSAHTHRHTTPLFLLSSAQITQAITKTLEGLDSVNKNLREVLRDMVGLMMWLWWECLHKSCSNLPFESVTGCIRECVRVAEQDNFSFFF